MKTIFVFAYYSYKDPVFQSAVLPYLAPPRGEQPRFKFVLLTWEQSVYSLSAEEIPTITAQLKDKNITWHRLKWHSGRLKLIKKLYDFVLAMSFGIYLIKKHKASAIYSEGFPGAILGDFLSRITQTPHVIHSFEPHADYMLEANVWTKKSWEYRLLSRLEIAIAKHAYALITATQKYASILINKGVKSSVHVLGSCIDLDRFQFNDKERQILRSQFGISDDQIVITYLGKFGGMYMSHEIFEFIAACQKLDNKKFFFFILTSAEKDYVKSLLESSGADEKKIVCKYLTPAEVPAYLSASDMGMVAVVPQPSKRFCSPIKTGEYMACGLSVITPEGISDDYLEIGKLELGVVYPSELAMQQVAKKVLDYIESSDLKEKRKMARGFALRNRDIQLGRKMLTEIFDKASNH